jgi:hypothetical protein
VERFLVALNFQAFVDESGSPNEFVLAGHIATPEQWAAFSKEWEAIVSLGTLSKKGKYHFKMAEMTTPERMKRVPQFYSIIEDHVISSISCRIRMDDHRRAKKRVEIIARQLNLTPNLGAWDSAYYMAFRMMLDKFHEMRST